MHRVSAFLAIIGTAATIGATVANAADAQAPSSYDWSGLYVGVNAGLAKNDSQVDGDISCIDTEPGGFDYCNTILDRFDNDYSQGLSDDDTVFTGGAAIGANWQFDSLVLGLEADVNRAGFDAGSRREWDAVGGGMDGNTQDYFITETSLSADWWGTVRARAGIAADNWLFYGTGGMAWGMIDASTRLDYCTSNLTECSASGWTASGSRSKTAIGWAAGAGIERGWRNWIVGVEYLYVDLGSFGFDQVVENVGDHLPPGGELYGNASVDYRFSVVRGTLKWKF